MANLFSTSSLAALGGAGGGGAIRLDNVDHDPLSSPPLDNTNNHARFSPSGSSPMLSPIPVSGTQQRAQPGRRRSRRRSSLPSIENDSYPARVIAQVVSILERIKLMLPEQYQPFFYVGLWFALAVTVVGLAIRFHSNIFQLLEAFASFVKSLGAAGPPIIVGALFLVSFPPLIGYSSLVTLSGYVFGFWLGFLVAYSGALLGAIACFVLCRKWFKANVRKLMAKNQSMKSVVRAVEKRGFKMLLLIRLAPYPYNLMNALFSATHISFFTYFLGTAISLLKLALHVYIGSTLSSLIGTSPSPPPTDGDNGGQNPQAPDQPGDGSSKALKVLVMVFSMIIAVVVGLHVWNVALKEIEQMEESRMERRRRKRESLARQRRSQLSNGSMAVSGHGGRSNHQHSGSSALERTASSGNISSNEGRLYHQSISSQTPDAVSGSLTEIDLTHAANLSTFGLEPEEYFVGGARGSFDDEDDDETGGEHDALVVNSGEGGRIGKSSANRVGQGYYGDQFNDDEDFDYDESGSDSGDDSDFLKGLDGDDIDGASDEEERDQDLDDMERGQDDVLDLSAAYESTYTNRLQNDSHDSDESRGWFSHHGGDENGR